MGQYLGDPYRQRSKLSRQQWEDIKRRYNSGETAGSLALEYKIAASTIYSKFKREPVE